MKKISSVMQQSQIKNTLKSALVCAVVAGSALVSAPALAQTVGDGDGDGVADGLDSFPCDATVSSQQVIPALNQSSTLFFEDQWPSTGDFDFNDAVIDYNVEIYRDGQNRVRKLRAQFVPRAYGALFENGLAWHLPISAGANVTVTRQTGSTIETVSPISGESDVVLSIANDIRTQLFAGTSGQINTDAGRAVVTGKTVIITVDIPAAANVTLLGSDAPFDVFLHRRDEYQHQIHRPQFAGTSQMRANLFGTLNDGSNATRKFVDTRGVPFVLDVPTTAVFPRENVRIENVFPNIVTFAASGGTQAQDFFSNGVQSAFAFTQGLGGQALPTTPNLAAIPNLNAQGCLALPNFPTSGLVAAYNFEEASGNALDLSGNGNHLTFNGATRTASGQGASAQSKGVVCGNNQTLTANTSASLRSPRNQLTVAGWVKPTTFSSPFGAAHPPTLAAMGVSGGNEQNWGFYIGNELKIFSNFPSRGTSSDYDSTSSGANLQLNTWVHVAVVVDAAAGTTKYYKNGALISTHPQLVALDQLNVPLTVCSDAGGPQFLNGTLDDLFIWNRALSDAEVTTVSRALTANSVGILASGTTCKSILDGGQSRGDGLYALDPDGAGGAPALTTFCDMTTDGGGWTLVANQAPTQIMGVVSNLDVNPQNEGSLVNSFRMGNAKVQAFTPQVAWRLQDLNGTGQVLNSAFFRPQCRIDWLRAIGVQANNIPSDVIIADRNKLTFTTNADAAPDVFCNTAFNSPALTTLISGRVSVNGAYGIGQNNSGSFCSIRMSSMGFGGGPEGAAYPCNLGQVNNQFVRLWVK